MNALNSIASHNLRPNVFLPGQTFTALWMNWPPLGGLPQEYLKGISLSQLIIYNGGPICDVICHFLIIAGKLAFFLLPNQLR